MEEVMLPRVHHDFLLWGTSNRAAKTKYNTNLSRLLPKQIYSPCIVDWNVLNNLGCAKEIKKILEIKVYEMGGEEEIFNVTNDELMTKKLIKFRLGHRGHTLTLLEFAHRLGLYHSAEISEEGFEVYFQGGLRNDENFNARDYWLSISSEEELHLSKSLTSNIKSHVLKWLKRKGVESQRESMICCGQFITMIARRMSLLTDEMLYGLIDPLYCRELDTTTLKELIDSNERLIVEDPALGVPRVAMPRPSRPTMQSYNFDKYAGVFEFMVGQYGVPLRGVYTPPGYEEQQQQDQE
ncbi:hypothetical protein Tco_0934119 [Tanacetum coccineum]